MLRSSIATLRPFVKKANFDVLFRAGNSAIIKQNMGHVNQRVMLSSKQRPQRPQNQNIAVAYYCVAIVTAVLGLSYAAVPLYKAFCSMTGFGGTTQRVDDKKAATVKPVPGARVIKVYFTTGVSDTMCWKFKPTQESIKLVPGETALAFYTVSNPSDKAITGIATYNVHPPNAGLYFSKIQCFCFEEQRLGAGEEIDMPVFFYIDPEFAKDQAMNNVNIITLSYTFFKTGEEEEETIDSVPSEQVVTATATVAI